MANQDAHPVVVTMEAQIVAINESVQYAGPKDGHYLRQR